MSHSTGVSILNSQPNHYDVIIIGAGVIGNAIARELSRYRVKTAVLEKELDVGQEISCRNSGVIHSGIHYQPGSLRAKLNVAGNGMMADLCRLLKVKIKYIGKLTVAQDKSEVETLHRLKEQGEANGVPGLELLGREKMEMIQPGVGGIMALHSPSTGIISPYGLTIALAENALANGAAFHLGEEVVGIDCRDDLFQVRSATGKAWTSSVLVNAAALHADRICRMVGIDQYRLYPCRGEYLVLDKRLAGALSVLVYPAPHKHGAGLGIHLTNTVDGNILVGPSNEYIDDPCDFASTAEIMRQLRKEGHELLPQLTTSDVTRSFSGMRPKRTPKGVGGYLEFVIESRKDVPGFINLFGIESPGLTSAPAIAQMAVELIGGRIRLEEKPDFISERPGRDRYFHELSTEEKSDLIAKDPLYGEVVCRCEQITKREIIDAISNPLGVKTVGAVKYRARAMMGRCQGGFCLPRIVEIMRREFGFEPRDYLLRGKKSALFTGWARDRKCYHA